jgi:hypothetical protein
MRLMVCVLTMLALAVPVLAADEKDPVKLLDLKDLKREPSRGDVKKPTEITSNDDLKKAFPESELAARLMKENDFAKSKLLFFAWSGSGQDKLSYTVEKDEVVFKYQPGLTRDLRGHFQLFAIPKDMKYKFADK